jgi:hypothetical protein
MAVIVEDRLRGRKGPEEVSCRFTVQQEVVGNETRHPR